MKWSKSIKLSINQFKGFFIFIFFPGKQRGGVGALLFLRPQGVLPQLPSGGAHEPRSAARGRVRAYPGDARVRHGRRAPGAGPQVSQTQRKRTAAKAQGLPHNHNME